jgi:hypothetical protein
MAGTLWAAFNGVTEWQDHRKSRQNADQRLVSSWFGGVESGVSPFILIHRFELWIGMEGEFVMEFGIRFFSCQVTTASLFKPAPRTSNEYLRRSITVLPERV